MSIFSRTIINPTPEEVMEAFGWKERAEAARLTADIYNYEGRVQVSDITHREVYLSKSFETGEATLTSHTYTQPL